MAQAAPSPPGSTLLPAIIWTMPGGRCGQPGSAAVATLRLQREAGQHARLRCEENRSTCAAAARTVAACVIGIEAVRSQSCRACHLLRADDDRAAAVRAAAVIAVGSRFRVRPISGNVQAASGRSIARFA